MTASAIPRVAGLDVGFSKKRKSTGAAVLTEGGIEVQRFFSVDEASQWLREFEPLSVVAIDGPILPTGTAPDAVRAVECQFSKKPFHDRCKPGRSDWGFGLNLRQTACHTADLLADVAPHLPDRGWPAVRAAAIVEAFPNLFLGVCLDDCVHAARPSLRRGRRFDWLYERWIEQPVVTDLAPTIAEAVIERMKATTNHDERAAPVCLLTAALVAAGNSTWFGNLETGWFFLPPRVMWQNWAWSAVDPTRPTDQ